jgi:hypothetical protein
MVAVEAGHAVGEMEEIRREIARTRLRVGEEVEALSYKTAVRARLRGRLRRARRDLTRGAGATPTATVRRVLAAQAVYYIGTGAWAVVHRGSFEAVSGRKHDYWLTRTVGALAMAMGATLASAAARGRDAGVEPSALVLSASSSVAFGAVDGVYAGLRRRISPVYLGDLAAQVVFLALLANALRAQHAARAFGRAR